MHYVQIVHDGGRTYRAQQNFYMIEATREHLDDLEELNIAEQRMLEIRAGRSHAFTLEEVERRLGLADEVRRINCKRSYKPEK